jgi:hypothetical protein
MWRAICSVLVCALIFGCQQEPDDRVIVVKDNDPVTKPVPVASSSEDLTPEEIELEQRVTGNWQLAVKAEDGKSVTYALTLGASGDAALQIVADDPKITPTIQRGTWKVQNGKIDVNFTEVNTGDSINERFVLKEEDHSLVAEIQPSTYGTTTLRFVSVKSGPG